MPSSPTAKQCGPDAPLTAFLEQARDLRRGATVAMQAGLQPAEQRAAEGQTPTTLAEGFQRQRLVARMPSVLERMAVWADTQGMALEALARLVPAVRAAVGQALVTLRPALQEAAARIRQRPERVQQRQQDAELQAGREKLLAAHMQDWWKEAVWGGTLSATSREPKWQQLAAAEEARYRAALAAMPVAKLRAAVQAQEQIEWEQEQARQAPRSGPSPGL